jgi:hypothetical protein
VNVDSVQPQTSSSDVEVAITDGLVQYGVRDPDLANLVQCETPYSPRVPSCAHVCSMMQAGVALRSVPALRFLPVEAAVGSALV